PGRSDREPDPLHGTRQLPGHRRRRLQADRLIRAVSLRAVVPPFVLDALARNHPDEAIRVAAAKTLFVSEALRVRRQLAPLPAPEHLQGEDREVYDAQHGTTLPGAKRRGEQDGDSPDQAVNEAWNACGSTYRYYLDIHGRRSVDGQGLPLLNSVHYDKNYDN